MYSPSGALGLPLSTSRELCSQTPSPPFDTRVANVLDLFILFLDLSVLRVSSGLFAHGQQSCPLPGLDCRKEQV
jgi:hypothetical protein